MTLTASEGAIWKQVTHVYNQWDPDRDKRMPVDELRTRLPAVTPALLDEVLARAASERLADLQGSGDRREFRPLQD